jgi:hypothetical protein
VHKEKEGGADFVDLRLHGFRNDGVWLKRSKEGHSDTLGWALTWTELDWISYGYLYIYLVV